MPLVDQEGRIFGRINLIDLAILLFITVATAAIVVTFLLPNRERASLDQLTRDQFFLVDIILLDEVSWLAERIQEGDHIIGPSRGESLRVMGVRNEAIPGNPDARIVTLRLYCGYTRYDVLMYQKRVIRLGEKFFEQLQDYNLGGTIYNITPLDE